MMNEINSLEWMFFLFYFLPYLIWLPAILIVAIHMGKEYRRRRVRLLPSEEELAIRKMTAAGTLAPEQERLLLEKGNFLPDSQTVTPEPDWQLKVVSALSRFMAVIKVVLGLLVIAFVVKIALTDKADGSPWAFALLMVALMVSGVVEYIAARKLLNGSLRSRWVLAVIWLLDMGGVQWYLPVAGFMANFLFLLVTGSFALWVLCLRPGAVKALDLSGRELRPAIKWLVVIVLVAIVGGAVFSGGNPVVPAMTTANVSSLCSGEALYELNHIVLVDGDGSEETRTFLAALKENLTDLLDDIAVSIAAPGNPALNSPTQVVIIARKCNVVPPVPKAQLPREIAADFFPELPQAERRKLADQIDAQLAETLPSRRLDSLINSSYFTQSIAFNLSAPPSDLVERHWQGNAQLRIPTSLFLGFSGDVCAKSSFGTPASLCRSAAEVAAKRIASTMESVRNKGFIEVVDLPVYAPPAPKLDLSAFPDLQPLYTIATPVNKLSAYSFELTDFANDSEWIKKSLSANQLEYDDNFSFSNHNGLVFRMPADRLFDRMKVYVTLGPRPTDGRFNWFQPVVAEPTRGVLQILQPMSEAEKRAASIETLLALAETDLRAFVLMGGLPSLELERLPEVLTRVAALNLDNREKLRVIEENLRRSGDRYGEMLKPLILQFVDDIIADRSAESYMPSFITLWRQKKKLPELEERLLRHLGEDILTMEVSADADELIFDQECPSVPFRAFNITFADGSRPDMLTLIGVDLRGSRYAVYTESGFQSGEDPALAQPGSKFSWTWTFTTRFDGQWHKCSEASIFGGRAEPGEITIALESSAEAGTARIQVKCFPLPTEDPATSGTLHHE